MSVELNINIPKKFAPLFAPKRYKIMHGGRGGGKSMSVAQVLLILGMQKRLRVLCTREIQKSLKDSVLRLLSDLIVQMSIESFYDVQTATIKGANGTEFIFAGLQDHTVDSIRSFVGIDIVWIEEASSVSARSWQILSPTIRKDNSEIWATFNPDSEDDEVYRRFVKGKDPQAWVCEIGWRDNKFFPQVLEVERSQLKALNDDLYQHVWEGKCRSLAGLLFKRKWFKFYDKLPEQLSPYMSSDYAVSRDEGDYTELGIGQLDDTGDLYLTDWYSDQAEPETWIDAAVGMVKRNKPKMWFEEKGVILRAVDAAITKRLRERACFVYRYPLASAGNKAERALGFAARCSAGAVWLPRNQPWAERLVNQLCSFTGEPGRVDDGVDVCSLMARGLDVMVNARVPKVEQIKSIKPFSVQHIEAMERDEAETTAERQRFYR